MSKIKGFPKLSDDIPESYLVNCCLYPRKEGKTQMFIKTNVGIFPTLDGYTIIPNEEFKKYTKIKC